MDSNGPQGRGELLKRCQEEQQLVRLRKKIVGYCGLTLCVCVCLCVETTDPTNVYKCTESVQ